MYPAKYLFSAGYLLHPMTVFATKWSLYLFNESYGHKWSKKQTRIEDETVTWMINMLKIIEVRE